MKKKIFSIIMLLVLVVPCAIMFSACKKDNKDSETPPAEAKVSEIELELASEHGYDYDAETNTISFVYGTNIELLKEKFVVTASLDDETSKTVSDYTIDTSAISGTPDVGNYVINFTYKEKSASVNVKITPKPIEKPTIQTSVFDFKENLDEEKTTYAPVFIGFDQNSMKYAEGSTVSSNVAGNYYVDIIPDSNHIWVADESEGEVPNSEAVRYEWRINKKSVFMSSPETLEFVWDGNEKVINFVDCIPQFYPFEKYFEIVVSDESTNHATDKGEYTVTVKLKDEKSQNYVIVDILYSTRNDDGTGDFIMSEDGSTITYYWNIV